MWAGSGQRIRERSAPPAASVESSPDPILAFIVIAVWFFTFIFGLCLVQLPPWWQFVDRWRCCSVSVCCEWNCSLYGGLFLYRVNAGKDIHLDLLEKRVKLTNVSWFHSIIFTIAASRETGFYGVKPSISVQRLSSLTFQWIYKHVQRVDRL